MAEKRRLSARDRREPSKKRRVSEATPQGPSKKTASTSSVALTPPPALTVVSESIEKPLPMKIKDGEALPTVPSPQPADLSDSEYQSIAESAVLLGSLERSKRKWLSDGILECYYTKPKKSKREQIEGKNPPKESMVKVGPCNIAVGPHLFDAMLYTVKDPNAPPPIQYTPPQRPMVHYGHPNFQQYQSYPHPPSSQQSRQHPHYPPAHSASPQPGYHHAQQHPPPQPVRTPNQPPPSHHPSHPPYTPQSAQRPPPSQHAQPPQPPKPSPDPVIQMLATRAASDPELKALMRVVASSKASQEQLRAFQAHIDELNAIIRAREQQQRQQQGQSSATAHSQTGRQTPHPPQRQPQPPASSQKPQKQQQPSQQSSTPHNRPQSQSQAKSQPHAMPRVEVQVPRPSPAFKLANQHSGQNSSKQPQTPTPQKSSATPQVKQEPGTATAVQTPSVGASSPSIAVVPPPAPSPVSGAQQPSPSPAVRQMPNQPPPNPGQGSRSGGQYPPYQGQSPAIQSRPQQHGSPTTYYRSAPPPPPPRLAYKSVVFEFTSPLTPYGSSTSGHAGSGDRYLFPEYSILEWLPGGNTVLASFLLIRKVDPNTPFPIETALGATTSRAKGKSTSKSKKADKGKDKDKKTKDNTAKEKDNIQSQPNQESAPTSAESKPSDQQSQPAETPGKSKPDLEKQQPEKHEPTLKEYYQPVTIRIYSTNPKFLEPLSRIVRPPDEVRRYMNEIMDRAERAPEGFLALRLPRENKDDGREAEDVRKSGTPVPGPSLGPRTRSLRGKVADEESEIENVDGPVEEEEDEEEEEELKDFYGPPTGLTPLRI